MKYFRDYTSKETSQAYKKYGAFYAFSDEQFKDQAKPNIIYVQLYAGLIYPKDNAKKLLRELDKIWTEGIKKDIQENGKENIIIRELLNHECFYTYDPTDAIRCLKNYPFTEEEIIDIFHKNAHKYED